MSKSVFSHRALRLVKKKKGVEKVYEILCDHPYGLTDKEGAILMGNREASTFGARRYDLMMENPPRACKSANEESRKSPSNRQMEVFKADVHASGADKARTLSYQDEVRAGRRIAQLARDIRDQLHKLLKYSKPITPIQKDIFRRLDKLTNKRNFK